MSKRSNRASGWLWLPVVAAVCGCGRDVVVRAGKTEVHRAELEVYRSGAAADPAATLDRLAERALLAEAARRSGLDEDPAVRARLDAAAREIRAQAYLEKALAAAAGEDALRKAYQERREKLARRRVHVAQIAFAARTKEERDRAQSRVSLASARVAGGEPFEKVARELSDDRSSAERGGDLGPILEGQVDAQFFEAAAKLKRGETSKPVESPFGYHLLKALEDPQTVTPTFDEVKGLLAADARREAEGALLARLKKDIGVKTYPDRVPPRSAPGSKPREGK